MKIIPFFVNMELETAKMGDILNKLKVEYAIYTYW